MRCAYSIDSSTELTASLKEREDIFVAQLHINFPDGSSIRDNELESTDELLEIMATSEKLPKTSQPTLGDFVNHFIEIKEKGFTHVIGLYLPKSKSGTIESAKQAQVSVDLEYWNPELRTISIATTHVLEEAVKYDNLDQIKRAVEKANMAAEAYLTLGELEYAEKGGRISKLEGITGSFLGIKPLIKLGREGIEYGDLIPFEKIRTMKKTMERLYSLISETTHGKRFILYAGESMLEYAQSLQERLENSHLLKASSGALVANGGPFLAVSGIRF